MSCTVAGAVERLHITLDDEYAAKLARLAAHTHVQPGTVARWLLSTALDEADADPRNVVELLDGIRTHMSAPGSGASRPRRETPSR